MTVVYDHTPADPPAGGLRCESRLMWQRGVRARCALPPHPDGDHRSSRWTWTDQDAEATVELYGPPKRPGRPRRDLSIVPLSPRLKAATARQLIAELAARLAESRTPASVRLREVCRAALIEQEST